MFVLLDAPPTPGLAVASELAPAPSTKWQNLQRRQSCRGSLLVIFAIEFAESFVDACFELFRVPVRRHLPVFEHQPIARRFAPRWNHREAADSVTELGQCRLHGFDNLRLRKLLTRDA
jgi:hypothetical protein